MYDLPYYKERNEEVILDFIEQHPFAFLCGCDSEDKPVATQVPVFFEERGGRRIIYGHIMRNTDHHKAFLHNQNALVVFNGSHTYVSATWYSDPNLPSTWNYMSVHAKGKIRFLNTEGLVEVLRKTTLHFEDYDHSSPTTFDNLPSDLVQNLMKAIVAFEIDVTSMDNVFKLSQDRDDESYHNIMKNLKSKDADKRIIAEEMKKRSK